MSKELGWFEEKFSLRHKELSHDAKFLHPDWKKP
jgi:hypothetical protein